MKLTKQQVINLLTSACEFSDKFRVYFCGNDYIHDESFHLIEKYSGSNLEFRFEDAEINDLSVVFREASAPNTLFSFTVLIAATKENGLILNLLND